MVDAVKLLGALLGNQSAAKGSGANVLTNLLGAVVQNNQGSRGGPDLGSLLGGVLGGQQQSRGAGSAGGLASMLGNVLGGQKGSGGGLGSMLSGVLGGNKGGGAAQANLGSMLGGVLDGQMQSAQGGGLDLGGLLTSALQQFGQAQPGQSAAGLNQFASPDQETVVNEQATLIIRAMINAAKADGHIDASEKEKIVGQLGEVTQDEIEFVQQEMASPLDVQGFINSIPAGMGKQVYAMSLTAIDLDTNEEARYLHELASGLGLDQSTVNAIHQQMGAPLIYR